MPQVKKTTITVDQAEDLEQVLGEYLSGEVVWNEPHDMLKELACPKDVIRAIESRTDSIASDLSALREGDVQRMFIDGASEDLKSLDNYLSKVFVVTGMRSRKRAYVWEVEVWG